MISNSYGVKRFKDTYGYEDINDFPTSGAKMDIGPDGLNFDMEHIAQDEMYIEGTRTESQNNSRTPGLSTPEYVKEPASPLDLIAADVKSMNAREEKLLKMKAGLSISSGVVEAVGGYINAEAKYQNKKFENDTNIQLAQEQAHNVVAESKFKMLREQTKGSARAGSAKLAAVAQGQSASGDMALTSASNEEIFAAQNMMNIEVNAMREVFNLESQQRRYESSTRMAEINADREKADSIISGLGKIGVGYYNL